MEVTLTARTCNQHIWSSTTVTNTDVTSPSYRWYRSKLVDMVFVMYAWDIIINWIIKVKVFAKSSKVWTTLTDTVYKYIIQNKFIWWPSEFDEVTVKHRFIQLIHVREQFYFLKQLLTPLFWIYFADKAEIEGASRIWWWLLTI